MYTCEICGRQVKKKIRLGGYTLCSKHMHQLHKYGKFLDNIQRTNADLNDYVIDGNVVVFNLYGQNNVKNGEFMIDLEDLEKVRYRKWRLNHSHVITGLPYKGTQRDLSHVVLDLPLDFFKKNKNLVVDHINGDPKDNRKMNLRICTQTDNVKNKSFMSRNTIGFIGVWHRKDRNKYCAEIRNGAKCSLGEFFSLEEAVCARYYAEQNVFGEFANSDELKRKEEFIKLVPSERKKEIYNATKQRLKNKGLWNESSGNQLYRNTEYGKEYSGNPSSDEAYLPDQYVC